MDYEKKYKEALERARNLHKDAINMGENLRAKQCEIIFPELKKLDNENIRKKLIKVCEDAINYKTLADYTTSFYKEAIDWLEKQGDKSKPSIRERYDRIKDSEWFKKTHEGMSVSEEEPKFHEGDWIIYNNDICQIVKREEGCNKLVTTFGIEKELVNERNLSTARLWTIQDAKNGDVLLSKHNQPFIYKGNFDDESVGAYCGIDKFGDDFLKDVFSCDWCYKEGVKPATKEQRDTLFAKMKDAGYEWDAVKKELKKVVQKPAWSEEDERNLEGIIDEIQTNKSQAPDYDLETYDRFLSWLKSLKERYTWKPSDAPINCKNVTL